MNVHLTLVEATGFCFVIVIVVVYGAVFAYVVVVVLECLSGKCLRRPLSFCGVGWVLGVV